MASITTRQTGTTGVSGVTRKDAPLTNSEIDNNFVSLNASKYESGDSPIFNDAVVSGKLAVSRVDQGIVSLADLNIDCSLGNYFTKTLSANSTFTITNPTTSRVYSFVVKVVAGASVTAITWPANVYWPDNYAPTVSASRTHLFMFMTDDGGTIWRGTALANYTA